MRRSESTALPWWLHWVVLGSVMLFTGCGQPTDSSESAEPTSVLARVNGQPITDAAFRHWWSQRPPAADTAESREAMLDRLIERSALAQAARKAGLDADPVVAEQIESLLIRRLQETQLQPLLAAVEVLPSEVESYYQAHLDDQFTSPNQRRLALLWFNTRGQAPLASRYRPRLEAARAEVLRLPDSYPPGAGFGALAIENSEHRASRYRGGDLGWLEASEHPGFLQAVLQHGRDLAEPGEMSPVIETDEGMFVIRLMDIRARQTVALDNVYEDIEQKLRRSKQDQLEAAFRRNIRDTATIHRIPDHLSALSGLGPSSNLAVTRPPVAGDVRLPQQSGNQTSQ